MKAKTLLVWIAVGVAATVGYAMLRPRVDPFEQREWAIDRATARTVALERIGDLGGVPDDGYVIVTRTADDLILMRMQEALAGGVPVERLLDSRPADQAYFWQVTVFDPDATGGRWNHRARVSPTGRLLQVERQMDDDEGAGSLPVETARRRADELLEEFGFDLDRFGEPEVRMVESDARADMVLRYSDPEQILGADVGYGVDVKFAGEELLGFSRFFEDSGEDQLAARFQAGNLLQQVWIFLPILLVPLVAVPFVRRYHAGEVGVHRGLQIGAAVLICGMIAVVFVAPGIAASSSFGILTKPQMAVAIMFQFTVVFYFPMAVLAFLTWSVGESCCREEWSHKLAGFDALFRGAWNNATFARASLRGVVCGLVIVTAVSALLALRPADWAVFGLGTAGPAWDSVQWSVIPVLAFGLGYSLYVTLFGQLFLVTWLARRFGRVGGPLLAAALGAILFFPFAYVVPTGAMLATSLLVMSGAVLVFLRYGLFATFMAQLTVNLFPVGFHLVSSGQSTMELNGALVLAAVMVPVMLSIKHILSDREFVYRYVDVPPHVRRIAERERQKVELETARGIQSSILPELPPELNGVQLAHRYLPATEVGGDFYDVLALDDGRLAIAVGDVAGHGVSSGLVMSMAKSALAVQVTFDPEVESVFRTLNRMVYQSARKRLLTTLCYALIDPARREMFFASAGHLFPYRITTDGRVEALESIAYPLGVRDSLEVRTRSARLESGDKLFLYSDGVVEASADGEAGQFGFERLEKSLARHGAKSVGQLRDSVLADLDRFVGGHRLDDDLTVLVLEIP